MFNGIANQLTTSQSTRPVIGPHSTVRGATHPPLPIDLTLCHGHVQGSGDLTSSVVVFNELYCELWYTEDRSESMAEGSMTIRKEVRDVT